MYKFKDGKIQENGNFNQALKKLDEKEENTLAAKLR